MSFWIGSIGAVARLVNFTGLIAAAVSLLCCVAVYYLVRGWSSRFRLIGLIVSGLLALPGATFSIYYLHWLPETEGYFEFRSWKGTEFFVVPIGIAGGFLATFRIFCPILQTADRSSEPSSF